MANKKDENLRFYELARAVPKEAQKAFNNGKFSGTDINPMWRIKKLTELFGPVGIGWYAEVVSREIRKADNGVECAFVATNLYIKDKGEWSKPIYGEGGNTFVAQTKNGMSVSDEAYKMAYTDALSNSAKALGIGADIWWSNDKEHSTKYDLQQERSKEVTEQPNTEQKTEAPTTEQKIEAPKPEFAFNDVINEIRVSTTLEALTSIWNRFPALRENNQFRTELTTRKQEILKQQRK